MFAVSCKDDDMKLVNTPAVSTLDPVSNENGSIRLYPGDRVSAEGLNLDKVGAVAFDGTPARIIEQSMKTMVFEVPVLDKSQRDDPYQVLLEIFDADGSTVVYKRDYYVTIPVTDAIVTGFSPSSGTVGTLVTISGRNLDRVVSVSFGGVSVDSSAFTSRAKAAITLAVPVIVKETADTELELTVNWEEGQIPIEETFTLKLPVFDAASQAQPAALGDEIEFSGHNLMLISEVKWGDEALLIASQTDSSIKVKVPSGLDAQDPAVVSRPLKAFYGVPAEQSVTILASFAVDTTPVGPAAPVFTSAAPADEGYPGLFLGRTVIVRGENLASVEKFKVDGVDALLAGAPTDIQASFVMPRSITGTQAKNVSLKAVWNGGNEADFGTIKVYPFYYTKGLRLRLGSNSSSSYPADNRENAFLLLDEGRVISVDSWDTLSVDAPAKTAGGNPVTTSANKVTGSKDAYYSAKPYMFATASSAHKLAFQNPANSASQLKCHRYADNTALPSTFGTPLIFMKIIANADLKATVQAGSLENILAETGMAGASAPAFGTSEGDTWVKGSVICMQYITWEHASTTGGKAVDSGDIRQQGYMYIRDITCGDAAGLAVANRVGYIEIDLYWSNVLNE